MASAGTIGFRRPQADIAYFAGSSAADSGKSWSHYSIDQQPPPAHLTTVKALIEELVAMDTFEGDWIGAIIARHRGPPISDGEA